MSSSIQGPAIQSAATSTMSLGMNDRVISLIWVAACSMPMKKADRQRGEQQRGCEQDDDLQGVLANGDHGFRRHR